MPRARTGNAPAPEWTDFHTRIHTQLPDRGATRLTPVRSPVLSRVAVTDSRPGSVPAVGGTRHVHAGTPLCTRARSSGGSAPRAPLNTRAPSPSRSVCSCLRRFRTTGRNRSFQDLRVRHGSQHTLSVMSHRGSAPRRLRTAGRAVQPPRIAATVRGFRARFGAPFVMAGCRTSLRTDEGATLPTGRATRLLGCLDEHVGLTAQTGRKARASVVIDSCADPAVAQLALL